MVVATIDAAATNVAIADRPYYARQFATTGAWSFTVPAGWDGMNVFLHFGAVKSFFYVWVNGEKLGFSKDSKTPAEWNITRFLKPGEKSGIHRHMWEELIFVAEGSGYDLHWDLKWDCLDAFQWEWSAEPKAYSWKRGDYIYIPPFTNHQHVASDHEECRLIVMSNRITKEMGFDWFDQVANAPSFDALKNGAGR